MCVPVCVFVYTEENYKSLEDESDFDLSVLRASIVDIYSPFLLHNDTHTNAWFTHVLYSVMHGEINLNSNASRYHFMGMYKCSVYVFCF